VALLNSTVFVEQFKKKCAVIKYHIIYIYLFMVYLAMLVVTQSV
jgi:hypothetical protein